MQPIVVSGPTASGKSALAVRLCQDLNGEVINLDSVQIYRGAEIGSAKITEAERQGVPHHLFDLYNPDQQPHAQDLLEQVLVAIGEIKSRGRIPVIVGSSGLYLSSLLVGLSKLPPGQPQLRAQWQTVATEQLFLQLQNCDPERAAILAPNDRIRIERSLECFVQTGRPISELYRESPPSPRITATILVLWPEREQLYARINRRAEAMIADGLLAETRTIWEAYGDAAAPLLRNLGYEQALRVLKSQLQADLLASEIAQATRHYAKRQYTYWRNQPRRNQWPTYLIRADGQMQSFPHNGQAVRIVPSSDLPEMPRVDYPDGLKVALGAISRDCKEDGPPQSSVLYLNLATT